MSNIPFRPVRGTEAAIATMPIVDGYVYYAVDSGRIYMDRDDERISMGGGGAANGSSIYFGEYGQKIDEDPNTKMYYYPISGLEDKDAEPRVDDIILDDAGALYRILQIGEENFVCSLLPLSGSGGGVSIIRPSLTLNDIENNIIINGQPFEISFVVKSVVDENNTPLANTMTVYWSLIDADSKQVYYTGIPVSAPHDKTTTLALGPYLKESTSTIIELYATGINHDEPSVTRQAAVSTVEMYLEQTSSYNPAYTYNSNSVTLSCNAVGDLSKILEWTFDGKVLQTQVLAPNSINPQTFLVPSEYTPHGYHTVEVNLYQNLGDANNPKKGLPATPLKYEIAVVKTGDSTQMPIIWLGDYQDTYYNYDIIQIPFLVYNPADTSKAEVRLYKNDIEIDSSPRTIQEFKTYSYWQIADAELNKENYYSLACGLTPETSAVREIKFKVVPDPNRDMTIVKQTNLKLNFDPVGRSNSEPATKRASWTYGEGEDQIKATFENFNWYNNGWYTDSATKNTFLRISNGAKLTIPFGALEFGTSDTSKQSNSIELAFKIRNIQNYSNLITNITRYQVPSTFDEAGNVTAYVSDETIFTAFQNQSVYNNYDAYLQATLDPNVYDNLQFYKVQKNINLKNAACGFYSGNDTSAVGICVGPQDTFFSNGQDTVNVSFVEDEMVYLSFVYDHNLKLLFIYINGAITGVIASTITGNTGFKINTDNIVFNSTTCDIDLYKIRIYNTALSVNDIVTNHAVDKKDVVIYDQNGLAIENTALKEYQLNFDKVLDYNKEHPEAPLMPYIVFDTTTTSDDKLPYAKSNGTTDIRVEFVNVPLDAAYARGELVQKAIDDGLVDENETDQAIIDEAVQTYYKHHCPSWTSTMSTGDVVTIEVQGTSSEFYPRRNFKVKTKYEKPNTWGELEDDDGNPTGEFGWLEEDCLNIYMHKGPFEDIYAEDKEILKENDQYYGVEASRMVDGWYMNNYTNPTDRWTMKVDYMESSGSYNAGFASLVGNAYTKHPLQDYVKAGVLTNTDKLESPVFEEMRWEDYRTSLLGFPVMAFQKRKKIGSSSGETEHLFIGYYRMLLDKGSDQVLGFKAPKKIEHKLVGNKKLRDVAECWEFANNARGFCSYRDPWERVELSFKGPRSIGDSAFIKLESGNIGGPVVLNNFEPRYFAYEDYLKNDEDGFYNFGNLDQDTVNAICDDLGIDVIDISSADAKYQAQDAAVDLMGHWEKVCKWIYSTDLQNVLSQGSYIEIPVGLVEYKPNTFYILDENSETGYSLATGEFVPTQTYFTKTTYEVQVPVVDEDGEPVVDENGVPETTTETKEAYTNAYATLKDYIYEPGKFYIKVSDAYSICNDSEFDSSVAYYKFETLSDDKIAEIADLLVAPATSYDANATYYTYNSDAKFVRGGGKTEAVKLAGANEDGKLTAEEFAAGSYYVASPVQFVTNGTWYKYDTKEYRTAKFVNELAKHFDLEYLATYFVMTEVFECYDSRGKNCMMASWGPLKEGGEYIWYPIFYDIDTQLGINNTGIPSFEFNVDATEAGNYSTSDSILWNNFYKFFKGSQILNKYKNLRQLSSTFDSLDNPPLQSVDYLEKWYTFEENTTKNIANRGQRPLIATNLDMYWKYITITNDAAISQGVAYIPGADGKYGIDEQGMYFYALQGDRSQSRRQFLTNRLEYIDSWLGQKNYARGGNNRIRGRVSANSAVGGTTSDQWVETAESPYWQGGTEFGTKTHDFDAEYWLTLKPIRSSYVVAGDDSANYPSKKYDGINPVEFKLNDIENGIRRSANYPEQLVYIYGLNQMVDYGDMNNLYWTEFYMEGDEDAKHLTRLQLGYDGYSRTDPTVQWYNKKLNGITLKNMPLLKEANFSRLGLQSETPIDLTASEKLENFRATGTSKLTSVNFADGVALNTLYLPESVNSLKLIQANLLDKVLTYSTAPTPINNDDGTVTPPERGLFIEGFFGDDFTSAITNIHLDGGALGHGSYQLLKRFYDVVAANPASDQLNRITMEGVNWSPYVQLTEGAIYNPAETNYYINNKHYGLVEWTKNASIFDDLVLNGQLYLYTGTPIVEIGDEFEPMLKGLRNEKIYADASSSQANPIISGIVYVNNTTPIEESYIRNTLQPMYPNLTFFFANVTEAYSAEFLYRNPTTGIDEYVRFKDGSKVPSVQKISAEAYEKNKDIWFTSPFDLYVPERTHYDFKGWSTNPDADPYDSSVITDTATWNNLRITSTQLDYTYYAIFEIHKYEIVFHDGDGSVLDSKTIEYGTQGIPEPSKVPYLDDSELDLYSTYGFVGYTDNQLTNKVVDLAGTTVRNNTDYYPVFEEISVYDNIHPEYFTAKDFRTGVQLTLAKQVQGKITIPATFGGKNVVSINSSFANWENDSTGIAPMGQYLTHVFFALDTKIESFEMYTFFGHNSSADRSLLKFVEFPDTLTSIGDYAFARCGALDYRPVTNDPEKITTARISGKNVTYVGQMAFQQAFTNYAVNNFMIGSKVERIGQYAFRNDRLTYSNIIIGTPTELSQLQFQTASPVACFNETGANVTFHSEYYDAADQPAISPFFQSASAVTII